MTKNFDLPFSESSNRPARPRVRFAIDVQQDESLQSILARSAREHCIFQMRPVLGAAGFRAVRPGRIHLLPPDDLRNLAEVLRQDPDVLVRRSATAYEKSYSFGDMTVPHGIIELERRRIGPRSLSVDPHHRFSWSNLLLPFCPATLEELVDTCSTCGQPLGWAVSLGIGTCEGCGELVHPSNSDDLDPELVAGYRVMANLMSFDREVRRSELSKHAPQLHGLDFGTVALTCLMLNKIFRDRRHWGRDLRPVLASAPQERAEFVAQAGRLLENWPENIMEAFTEAIDFAKSDHKTFSRLWNNLKALASDSKCKSNDSAQFIVRSIPDLDCRVRSRKSIKEKHYSMTEAFLALGVQYKKLLSLVDADLIDFVELPAGKRRNIAVNAAQIDRLAEDIRRSIRLRSLAQKLKLPVYAIEQVAAAGIVEPIADDAVKHLFGEIRVSQSTAQDLLDNLSKARSLDRLPSDARSLLATARVYGGGLKPWAAVIHALISNEIKFWIKDRVNSYHIFVRPLDILWTMNRKHVGGDQVIPRETKMSRFDASDVLNIPVLTLDRSDVLRALESDGRPGRDFASVAMVKNLASRVISLPEIALRSDDNHNRILKDGRLAGIDRILFGWDRKQVEQRLFR